MHNHPRLFSGQYIEPVRNKYKLLLPCADLLNRDKIETVEYRCQMYNTTEFYYPNVQS